jgi:hypothetical protein
MAKMTPLERARQNERLANEALAQGNIAAAQAYQANIAQQLSRSATPLPGVSNVQSRVNTAVTAATDFRTQVEDSQKVTETDDTGTGTGTGTDVASDEEDYQDRRDRLEAKGILQDALRMYGLEGLVGDLDRIIKDSGNSASVAMNQIRQTEAYRDRFKGLLGLQQRGITDVTNEAEYIQLESNYRQVFREAGIQNFLGDAGSKPERDAIAKIVGDFSLSVNEVRDRVSDAQRVVADTPQEVRDSLQRFYNVDPATLTAYVLDPSRTSSEINRRANAAIVGGYAQRQGLDFGAGISERIGSLFAGEGDLQGTQAEPQLTTIAEAARGTKRLAQIEQSALSDEDVALSTLDLDATAKQRVEGLKSRERARFGGSGAFTSTALTGVNKI